MPDETLLLAVLSVLAVWALLGVLAIGLVMVLKTLQSVRGWLERIAMGVRAIESETAPLGREVDRLGTWLDDATQRAGS